ncbi:MAG: hypothetical protein ACRDOA_06435 [Streptosporangiaceae bacterium]
MNDTTLSAAVRDQLTAANDSLSTVHLTIPASEIIARARKRRTRHRRTAVAGAGAIAAGLALAVAALVPGSGPRTANSTGPVQLTAWTVTKLADGNIDVQIRELRDPAGLQARLRADGVPASVTFFSQQNPACHQYPADLALLERVFPDSFRSGPPPGPDRGIVINPAGLPAGAGVQLAATFSQPSAPSEVAVAAPVLVHVSPGCTGS